MKEEDDLRERQCRGARNQGLRLPGQSNLRIDGQEFVGLAVTRGGNRTKPADSYGDAAFKRLKK
jgi:hypothetical protein